MVSGCEELGSTGSELLSTVGGGRGLTEITWVKLLADTAED